MSAALTAVALAAVTLSALPATVPSPAAAASARPANRQVTAPDWSVALVDSTTARYTPSAIGGWSYPVGLYLYGQYLTYRRTHEARYLTYIKDYVDRFVKSDGTIDQPFNSLDSMQACRLLVILHRETGQDRYREAAKKIRDRLNTYPRTADGGFWHADTASRANQLWADGVYMVNPFLVEYGKEFGDRAYANDEAASKASLYGSHLQIANGLLRHAYDESKSVSWADPQTGLAPEHLCLGGRLVLHGDHQRARRDPRQPPPTGPTPRDLPEVGGRPGEVPGPGDRTLVPGDRQGRPRRQLDRDVLLQHVHLRPLARCPEQGYLDPHYRAVARRGYQGVLAKLSVGTDGLTNLADISVGTNVGDYAYYIARTRATNDFHGLGAFLIMNEQLRGD
ncbi:Unsaturated rhamnogalacturonyl hydrolase YteR [Streptomyces alboniger]